ncbi:type II secretion system protein N [Sphingomonas sp.]|jgi:general secretion pathway protein N|uniref:type II secretion system protein N n=1 Tax=Sphingomonas sp. TaxID=28214 RepID=UPI002DE2083E|nr:type II secretion system protein N [Sphingomonas sp.]HEV2569378.1 type II secretion system protein N [Sphingomonas sp.]
MRILVPTRRLVLFAALFALALLITLPLRLVLGAGDGVITAREATGSVWSGSLKEARLGPASLGDLSARLSPLALLTGQARIEVERPSGAADRFAGAFATSARRRSAESVTGMVPVEGLFGALPIASIELTDVTVRFRDDQCDRAEGLVRATLSSGADGLPLPASVSGAARCDRGALLLPLASGSGAEGVALRIFGDGRYSAELRVRASEPDLVARLTGAGFSTGPGGYVLTIGGRF